MLSKSRPSRDDLVDSMMITIPVFNRLELLRRLLRTLADTRGIDRSRVVIFNDASTEFSADDLKAEIPNGFVLLSRPENSGRADFAVNQIFLEFLRGQSEYLLILDSDLLVSSDCLEFVRDVIQETDGVLSLFNTKPHPVSEETSDERVVLKTSIGFAGSVWSRAIVEDIIGNVPASERWDWDICAYLRGRIRISCARNSKVQHIGFLGQNSSDGSFDYGSGFAPQGTAAQAELAQASEFIIDDLKTLIVKSQSEHKKKIRTVKRISMFFAALSALLLALLILPIPE